MLKMPLIASVDLLLPTHKVGTLSSLVIIVRCKNDGNRYLRIWFIVQRCKSSLDVQYCDLASMKNISLTEYELLFFFLIKLSIIMRVALSFPLRTVEIDCQKV